MLSATYEQLLSENLPQAIATNGQYRQVGAKLGALIGKGRSGVPEEGQADAFAGDSG